MAERTHLPDPDRLSVLAGSILLAYALGRFINLPVMELNLQLPGVFLQYQINVRSIVAFLVAGLTASGAAWLLRSHPVAAGQRTMEHWLLPSLTAWVIGLPLYQLPLGYQWWLGFAIGGALIVLVVVAEYVTIDPGDLRNPAAVAGLTAVSFALFLILAVSLRASSIRLFQILPALTLASGLIGIRTLHLRLHGRWEYLPAGLIALVCAQLTAAFHYLPVSSLSFGLFLLGPIYALTSLITNLEEGQGRNRSLIEPLVMLVIILATGWWLM